MAANDIFTRRQRETADAAELHEAKMRRTLSDRYELRDALSDHTHDNMMRLAEICQIAATDNAEGGRLLAQFAEQAAHESARYRLGDDAEAIPAYVPRSDVSTLDLMTMAARGIPKAVKS